MLQPCSSLLGSQNLPSVLLDLETSHSEAEPFTGWIGHLSTVIEMSLFVTPGVVGVQGPSSCAHAQGQWEEWACVSPEGFRSTLAARGSSSSIGSFRISRGSRRL